jgi:hypothetical protein
MQGQYHRGWRDGSARWGETGWPEGAGVRSWAVRRNSHFRLFVHQATSFCKKEYVTTSYKMGFSSYLEADRSDKKGPVKGLISKCPRMHAKSEENERKMSSVFTKHGSRAKRSIEKQRLQKGG